jgi:hypothetical protein
LWRHFFLDSNAGHPRVEIDISDYKLNKIRAILCHASQDPGLPGRPEEELGKIPCTELYTVARDLLTTQNFSDWFETQDTKQATVNNPASGAFARYTLGDEVRA